MENSLQNRRNFMKVIGLGAAAMVLPGCSDSSFLSAAGKKKRPNMVIALCDDLGYGDLSCYGHPFIQTSNLDKLAAEGMKLTDCYAAAPVCSPSRAGMLTGRNPNRCGVYDWIPHNSPVHLKKQEISVAKILKKAGYATCHVGKWHSNGKFNSPEQPQPNDHGFDYWFSTQNNARPTHHNPKNFVRNGIPVGRLEGYSSELIADEAINWLRNHWDRNTPFCLFVWFHAPHEPIATDAKFMKMYEGHKEAIYYGNVSQMDHAFGRLMKAMDDMALRDDAFVMFTSDNGPETLNRYRGSHCSYGSPGPLRGMKLHMYEGGIRVPGIICYPGQIKPGSVSSEPINGTDILPTLCDLAGAKIPTDRAIDGAGILPVFRGEKIKRTVPLYWRYDSALSKPFTVAMRQGDWKILADDNMTVFELYNLRKDKKEKNNLASSEAGRLEAMKKTLIKLHREIDLEGPRWPKWKRKK
ncbi:MAG: sulfatase-like hydrolase/transferase [Sedimentisphaerales bacterium]|nr:sulfatase-like hydrolase/transferase [Sedimentisphaerales bacterium]